MSMSIGIMGIDQISLDPTFVRRKEGKTWFPVCSTFVPLIYWFRCIVQQILSQLQFTIQKKTWIYDYSIIGDIPVGLTGKGRHKREMNKLVLFSFYFYLFICSTQIQFFFLNRIKFDIWLWLKRALHGTYSLTGRHGYDTFTHPRIHTCALGSREVANKKKGS